MFLNYQYHSQQQQQELQQIPPPLNKLTRVKLVPNKPKHLVMRNYRFGRNHRPPNTYFTEQYLIKQWLQGNYYNNGNINIHNDNDGYFRSVHCSMSPFLVTKFSLFLLLSILLTLAFMFYHFTS